MSEVLKSIRNEKFKQMPIDKLDMFGKSILEGHILAVRYVWNSYVAPVFYYKNSFRLMVTTSPDGHDIRDGATYQIIGHWDEDHDDYNQAVKDWILNDQEGNCPVKTNIYESL